jgi:hypothetical protein
MMLIGTCSRRVKVLASTVPGQHVLLRTVEVISSATAKALIVLACTNTGTNTFFDDFCSGQLGVRLPAGEAAHGLGHQPPGLGPNRISRFPAPSYLVFSNDMIILI